MLYFSGRFGSFPVAFSPCFRFPRFVRLVLAALAPVGLRVWPLARLSSLPCLRVRLSFALAPPALPPWCVRLFHLLLCFALPSFPVWVRLRSRRGRLLWFARCRLRRRRCSSAFPVARARWPSGLLASGRAAVPARGASARWRLGWAFRLQCFCRQASSRPVGGVWLGSRLARVGFSCSPFRPRCFSGAFLLHFGRRPPNGGLKGSPPGFLFPCFSASYPHFFLARCGKINLLFCIAITVNVPILHCNSVHQ